VRKGIQQAEAAYGSGSRLPRLRLAAGDRARFHFLSSGDDEYFGGGVFHTFAMQTQGGKSYNKEVVCLRNLTEGEESCPHCEAGHDQITNRFAVWVYVHFILHLGDNPNSDEDSPAWDQVQVGQRFMFRENVGQPLLIWLAYGKQWSWFGQFKAAYTKYGTLSGRVYELRRVGTSMNDTDYTLATVKEEPLKADVPAVTTIEEVFRSTLDGVGSKSPSLGPIEPEKVVAPGKLSPGMGKRGRPKSEVEELEEPSAPVASSIPSLDEPEEDLM